jgi:hypothetical protein
MATAVRTEKSKKQYLHLKGRIKSLAAEQKKAKTALRMPGKNREQIEARGKAIKELGYMDYGWAQMKVTTRRVQITAALNLYHEMRGSEHRHNVREGDGYWYISALYSLKKELEEI